MKTAINVLLILACVFMIPMIILMDLVAIVTVANDGDTLLLMIPVIMLYPLAGVVIAILTIRKLKKATSKDELMPYTVLVFVFTSPLVAILIWVASEESLFPKRCSSPYPPYGNAPYGNAPYGNAPYGNAPYGNAPYGNAPYGNAPYGNAPYGNAPYGNAPYGNAPYGDAPYGNVPPQENAPYGNVPPSSPPQQ